MNELTQKLRQFPLHHGIEAALEIERLTAERDAMKAALADLEAQLAANARLFLEDICKVEAERDAAQADAKRWQAVKPLFRVMSANIDGNHTWVQSHYGALVGGNMDQAADRLAIKGEQS